MEGTISKIYAIFLAFLLLIVFPILSFAQLQDETARTVVFSKTTQFVDSVRNLGYITPNMYKEYVETLGQLGNIYDVKIEHHHRTVSPILDDGLNIIVADSKAQYDSYYKLFTHDEIMEKLFPTDTTTDATNYLFTQGDYIVVTAKNRVATLATRIQEILYNRDVADSTIIVRYGGLIKDQYEGG